MLKDVEKMKADFSKWAATLPPRVRDVAEQYPTWNCYRSTTNHGHYRIYSYAEPKDESVDVTLTLVHGRDSFLPGVAVYGQRPGNLAPCGCGLWLPPTDAQTEVTRAHLEAEKAAGKFGKVKCSDPACGLNHDE